MLLKCDHQTFGWKGGVLMIISKASSLSCLRQRSFGFWGRVSPSSLQPLFPGLALEGHLARVRAVLPVDYKMQMRFLLSFLRLFTSGLVKIPTCGCFFGPPPSSFLLRFHVYPNFVFCFSLLTVLQRLSFFSQGKGERKKNFGKV